MSRRLTLIKKKKNCQYCGRKVGQSSGTIDHYVPRSKGGLRSKNNVKLACKKCNSVKGDMDGDRWMRILPLLLEAGYMDMSRSARRQWRKVYPQVFDKAVHLSKNDIKVITDSLLKIQEVS